MTNYEIPAEPAGDRVWLLDHPDHGGPLPADRVEEFWKLRMPGGRYDLLGWAELLAVGTVTDEDPSDMGWIGGPLTADEEMIRNRGGRVVARVDGEFPWDVRLATLIVRLVNDHIAAQAGEPS